MTFQIIVLRPGLTTTSSRVKGAIPRKRAAYAPISSRSGAIPADGV